jgi:protein-L-isoaspartate(D-aspartate) O-methyltransferase
MDFGQKRAKLVKHLQSQIKDTRVLSAIERIPRECFVPERLEEGAYQDSPLPIGHKQTISQPLIVAMMVQALELTGQERVLEIGTGSGYQAAVLAELVRQVITTERIASLAESAGRALRSLGLTNVQIHLTEDSLGWEKEAPYDAIIVTAGSPRIPERLLDQLAVGGHMVIPVGSRELQQLYQITKLKDRNIVRDLGGCRFVPLVGHEAWEN